MMTEICPHVFLGDEKSSCKEHDLKWNKIRTVIQFGSKEKDKDVLTLYNNNDIRLIHFPIVCHDLLASCYYVIKQSVTEKRNVLVQCSDGNTLSPMVIVYFLLKNVYVYVSGKPQEPVREKILEHLKRKNRRAKFNSRFLSLLRVVEEQWRKM